MENLAIKGLEEENFVLDKSMSTEKRKKLPSRYRWLQNRYPEKKGKTSLMKINIFEVVKHNITTKYAVIHYEFHPNQSGMICCPFHNDKHPSMKMDKRFYCLGYGVSEDVIEFVAMYFTLPVKDAAMKLVSDFGLATDEINTSTVNQVSGKRNNPKVTQKNQEVIAKKYPSKEITKAFRTVADHANILKEWKKEDGLCLLVVKR